MSRFLIPMAIVALLLISLHPTATLAQSTKRPNVVFILIDDFGWKDVGYNGSTFYETPRIDSLAREWMRFNSCYTASPMCSPTRLSILTGKHPARHGVTQWLSGRDTFYGRKDEKPRVYCPGPKSAGIQDKEFTIGEAFRKAGYETAFYGKWHMGKLNKTGGPGNHGYDSQLAVIEENRCKMFFPFNDRSYFPDAKEGDYFTDLLTNAAVDFVSTKHDKPFYLHLCHFAMHAEIKSKPDLRKKFEKKFKTLPQISSPFGLDDYSHKQHKVRQDDAEYAGELANLDENIGRLIDSLKKNGLYKNTIVVLTGDNGGRSTTSRPHPTSVAPLRLGKEFLFEGGLRTPCLIHWPGHTKAGSASDVPVTSMDFYPTLLEMAGLPAQPKQHVDGLSIVPLIEGKTIKRDTLHWHFPHYQGGGAYPASAIRVGDYKLIHNYHHDNVLLYDLASDPYEKSDLSSSLAAKARDLDKQLMAFLKSTSAYVPGPIDK